MTAAIIPAWLVADLPGAPRAAVLESLLAILPAGAPVSLLLEGLPADGRAEVAPAPGRRIHVLAPGCLCCIGNLTLRVTLARVLRLEAPQAVIIALADARHVQRMTTFLQGPPWNGRLHVAAPPWPQPAAAP